ncbi:hypothetical protein FZI91_09960 [Mycobacterium sp. CBMA271]|uniref:TPR repeat region-containing protein n=1 Tax=unclassified Mycobacteroides TaxID=2618759 RepID=UPI0012DBDE2B|nr:MULTISPECIES: hypothetical protein [unclassified Mycobacteroides]MUM16664.1 hypothetical protein [Mycobacteroides sp. CBMA 326]MUM22026.1 hypothetical protein [Mycobacteroides sp. CBMA 271]
MGMTLYDLQQWPPHIKALADAATKRGDASQQAGNNVQAIVDMSTWQGDAGDAAKDAMKRSAARFDTAGTETLLVAMQAMKAEGESQTLADDIGKFLAYADEPPKVDIDPKTNNVTPPDISQLSKDELQKVINKLKDLRDKVSGLVARGEQLDDELARVLDEGTGGHTMAMKGLTEETPQQAQQDVHDVLAGTATDEERARVQAASTLSPDQIADRDAGRPVQLTRSQQQILGQLNDQMKGMSIEDIHRAERRLGDNKSIVANALQMMGSKQYAFAKSEQPGEQGPTDKLTTGGFNELPTSVQNALNDKSVGYNYVPLEHGQGRGVVTEGNVLGNLDRLSDVIKDGDAGFQRGTELDQKLMQRGADILRFENDNKSAHLGPADSTIQNIFSSAGRDHIVDHNMMVNTDGTRNDQFLKDLTHHQFPDGGTAAGSLMSWTHDSAHPGPGVSPEMARMSGETARAYSTYVMDQKDLNSLPTSDDQGFGNRGVKTLGELSPGLARGMATGLVPYAGIIAGGDHNILGATPGFDDMKPEDREKIFDTQNAIDNGTMPRAKALFSVLDTDKEAATTLGTALYGDSVLATNHYAEEVKQHGTGPAGDLDQAGRFRGLADAGMAAANDAQHNDASVTAEQKAKDLQQMKETAYSAITKVLPIPEGATTGFGIMTDALKSSIVGSVDPSQLAHSVVPDLSEAKAQQQLLSAYVATGVLRPDQVPSELLVPAGPEHPGAMKVGTLEDVRNMKLPDGTHPHATLGADDYHTLVDRAMHQVPPDARTSGTIKNAYDSAAKDIAAKPAETKGN